MDRLVFADGERIGILEGGKITYFESEAIKRYREYAESRSKNSEWKYGGEGAVFRGDSPAYGGSESVYASVNDVAFDGGNVLYAFTVNETSGVRRIRIEGREEGKPCPEDHIYSSAGEEILSLCPRGRELAVTVGHGPFSSIGVLDAGSAELRTLTEGDCRDADPVFDGGKILFDSAGAGLGSDGTFTGRYAPSALLVYDPDTFEITELLSDRTLSYLKPAVRGGALYYIRRPEEKRRGNVFADILLFPFRILKAIFGFLQAFVMIFGKTSLSSASAGGDEAAKNRGGDAGKLFIDGRYVETEKELKRNRKSKEKDYGFIPLSWKLMRRENGKEEVVKSGVCDYALCPGGGLYCTDGRHIYFIGAEGRVKVADAERCLAVAAG